VFSLPTSVTTGGGVIGGLFNIPDTVNIDLFKLRREGREEKGGSSGGQLWGIFGGGGVLRVSTGEIGTGTGEK